MGQNASDARQSRRKELIAVRRRVPEGLGGPGHIQRSALGGENQRRLTKEFKELKKKI
jgi:hypothetical protein